LFALEKDGEFAKRWRQGPISADEVGAIADLLEKEGGKAYAEAMSEAETGKALDHLQRANPRGEAGEALLGLANMLLKRKQ
jgi:geranylgeranyl pyrophosphate synthase